MTPRASFVIPAYNAERWISKTIWSCRNQTEKKVEIIVVNDGSTDDTAAIIDFHAKDDSRVRVFHRENQGRSAARNFGNDQATSAIIMVLDADDLATRNRAKDTLTAFQLKRPDFLYGSAFLADAHGNTDRLIRATPFDATTAKQEKLNRICHSTMAYTKKLALDVRYEDGAWSKLGLDDWKFQWEVYRKGYTIICIKNALCYYRVTDDGTMATRDPKEVDKAKTEYLEATQI